MAACRGYKLCPRHLKTKFHNLEGHLLKRTYVQHELTEQSNRDSLVEEDESHYPPVKPKCPPGSWGRMDPKHSWEWHDNMQEIAEIKTVQGKLNYLTKQKYRTWQFYPVARVPRLFNYQCNKTKTYPVLEKASADKLSLLPDIYKFTLHDSVITDCNKILKTHIKTLDYIRNEKKENETKLVGSRLEKKHVPRVENVVSHLRTKELLMSLIGYLSGQYDHIRDCTVDENVRIAATWNRHGVKRYVNVLKSRQNLHYYKHPENFKAQNNSAFFSDHYVNFLIRKENPLPQFVTLTDPVVDSVSYLSSPYHPRTVGQFHEILRRGVQPGFNVGDPCEFIHLNVILLNERHLLRTLRDYREEIYDEAVRGYALSTGFVSTVAQAHFQGFNIYQDLTYPVTTQTIVTDGQKFVFSAYQLNTLHLWKDDVAHPCHNVCWISEPYDLWKKTKAADSNVDDQEDVVINQKTLETLLKFLVISPQEVKNPRPYLEENTKPSLEGISIPMSNEEPKELVEEYQCYSKLENGFVVEEEET